MSPVGIEENTEEEVIDRLCEAFYTFRGERLSGSQGRDLMDAIIMNGLDLHVNND